jgi:hypothetical protein
VQDRKGGIDFFAGASVQTNKLTGSFIPGKERYPGSGWIQLDSPWIISVKKVVALPAQSPDSIFVNRNQQGFILVTIDCFQNIACRLQGDFMLG